MQAVRSLGLDKSSTLRECAEARNAYTVQRLRHDFHVGLRELAAQAGDADADALVARFELPVFTVSSMDYQKLKGLRPADGPPKVWHDAESCGVPRLARHVQRAALVRRKALSLRRCRGMESFTRGLVALLESKSALPAAVRSAARATFDEQSAKLSSELRAACTAAETAIKDDFETLIQPQLKAGAAAATREALGTATEWGRPNTQGGLHWATYKATIRRNGVFRINMNEELTAPILKAVSVQWEKAFLSGMQRTLGTLQKCAESAFEAFYPAFVSALAAAEVPQSAIASLGGMRPEGMLNALSGTLAELKEAANKQQRELSRGIEPVVTENMKPGYSRAYHESGTGSHRRRVDILERHVRSTAPQMFTDASGSIVEQLTKMHKDIGTQLDSQVVQASLSWLHTTCCVVWDELGEHTVAERRRLAPRARQVLVEAINAVRRLDPSAARHDLATIAGEGAEADGDDLVDVTDEALAIKRARQRAETIQLNDDHDENVAPTQSDFSAKVKAEVKRE